MNSNRNPPKALGGFLLEFMGLHGAYFLGAILYATAAFVVWRMVYLQHKPSGPAPKVLTNLIEGFRYARSELTPCIAETFDQIGQHLWGGSAWFVLQVYHTPDHECRRCV